jgi:hypothetical protein
VRHVTVGRYGCTRGQVQISQAGLRARGVQLVFLIQIYSIILPMQVVVFSHLPFFRLQALYCRCINCSNCPDRISVILLLFSHGPDRSRHLVGERDSHEHAGFARRQTIQPGSLGDRFTAKPIQTRHCADDQKPANVPLPSFGYSPEALLAARGMLLWDQAEPSGEVATAAERLERRREGFDGKGCHRSDARNSLQATRVPALRSQFSDLQVQALDSLALSGDLLKQQLAEISCPSSEHLAQIAA